MNQWCENLLRPSEARARLNRLQPMLARHLAGMGSARERADRKNRLFEGLFLPCHSLEGFFWNRFQRGTDCYLAGEVATDLVCKLLQGETAYRASKGKLGPWVSGAIQCDVLDLLAREKTRLDHQDRLARHGEFLRRRTETPVGEHLDQDDFLEQVERLTQDLGNPRELAVAQSILSSLRETGEMPVQTRLAEALNLSDAEVTRCKQGWLAKLRGPLADRAVVLGVCFEAEARSGMLKA
jgi:hypothetical protein